MRAGLPESGSAMSSAVRNCEDTSPRTRIFSNDNLPGRMSRGGKSLLPGVIDASTNAAQRVDQVADRPLVHARHAGEAIFAAGERERGGERTKRGACVPEEQICLLDRKSSGDPGDSVL